VPSRRGPVSPVPCHDPGWNRFDDVGQLAPQLRAEIGHFFSVYKDLDPTRHSEVLGWGDHHAAARAVDEARAGFQTDSRG